MYVCVHADIEKNKACNVVIYVSFLHFCREKEEDKEMADFLKSKFPRNMKRTGISLSKLLFYGHLSKGNTSNLYIGLWLKFRFPGNIRKQVF